MWPCPFTLIDIVHELFGCSESTGPHTSSKPDAWRVGYCGRPLPGVHTQVDTGSSGDNASSTAAATSVSPSGGVSGELWLKGRHIFMGYMYMPEQTAAAFTDTGFYRTGDVVEFDLNEDYGSIHNQEDEEDGVDIEEGEEECAMSGPLGYVKITGRIKDLIISAGGENIPPVLIEEEYKTLVPCVSNALVVGDRKRYLTMLVTLKTVTPENNDLAPAVLSVGAEIGSHATTVEEAVSDPKWTQYLHSQLTVLNQNATSNAHKVQKLSILGGDFTEGGGELTPTLKVKRNVVCEKYANVIENMYAQ